VDGTPFGRYRLVELLGRGGMGEVWRAYDTAIDRIVALKVLPANFAGDPVYQERFRREARAAAALDEPHVVPIYDYGEIDGQLYVTMRLIKGRDLQTVLRDGPLSPARAVAIIEQVAQAVYAAHRVGLVHRDIKPSNILLGDNDFAYLIDFGIARAVGETGLTSTGVTIGTWSYMAPERFQSGTADARADIYALACVLCEALTGQPPFPGHTFEQVAVAHMLQPPPRPSTQQDGVPAAMDDVIATGMAKNPDQRYATTVELARAAHDATTVPLPRPGPTMPAQPSARPDQPTAAPINLQGTQRAPAPSAPGVREMAGYVGHDGAPPQTGGPLDSESRRKRVRRSWVVAGVVTPLVAAAGVGVVYFLPGRTSSGSSAPVAAPPSGQPGVSVSAAPGGVSTPPLGPPRVTSTIQVGNGAFGVAVDPSVGAAYVANSAVGSLSVIDTAKGTVTATIAVGRRPVGVAVDPATRNVYVTNYDDSSVSVIDPTRGFAIATVGVGGHPGGVVVDLNTHTAYVTNGDNGSVSVIDTTVYAVNATVPTGSGPNRVAVDPTAHRVYVTNSGDATVSVIDTTNRTVVGTVAVPPHPGGVAVDPASHSAYVTDGDNASVSVIDTTSLKVTATIPVGQRPGAVAIDPAAHTAYVANYNDASVSVIDTTSRAVSGIPSVGNNPLGLAVDPTTHSAYVTSDLNHGSVTVLGR
jgi:serine/threonine-protein kinase